MKGERSALRKGGLAGKTSCGVRQLVRATDGMDDIDRMDEQIN